MPRYSTEQLAVLFVVALALLAAALWENFAPAAPEPPARFTHACELAGMVAHPGVYRFNGQRTLGSLLEEAGESLEGIPDARLAAAVPSGSRIVIGGTITIESMSAQDRLNCRLPLAVNSASAEDLALIPGMGLKTAQAIIQYRDARGGLQDIAELGNIEGIGPKKLEQFRPFLTVAE